MNVSVLSGRSIRKNLLKLAGAVAIAGGVLYGAKGYDMVKTTWKFNHKNLYTTQFKEQIQKNIEQSYSSYLDLRKNLIFDSDKEELYSMYVSQVKTTVDDVISAYEINYNYAQATEYLSNIQSNILIADLIAQKSRVEKFHPEKLLQKADTLSDLEKMAVYQRLLSNNSLPERESFLREKINESKFNICKDNLEKYFMVRGNPVSSIDAYTSYLSNIRSIGELTAKQKSKIYSILENGLSPTVESLANTKEIIEVTYQKVDITPLVKRFIDAQIRYMLNQQSVDAQDIANNKFLQDISITLEAGMDRMLAVAYLQMIPKFEPASERQGMLDEVLETYPLNKYSGYISKIMRSVKPANSVDSIKYDLMMKGLGGK